MEKATKIYLYGIIILGFTVLICLFISTLSCTKQPAENTLTGVWHRDNGTVYSFFDDSRFQQSDQPGKQWIWEKKGTRVFLYGTPDRVWTVDFIGMDEVEVIETDTFKITRQ